MAGKLPERYSSHPLQLLDQRWDLVYTLNLDIHM
jgi:hypothetical protein